MKHFKRIAALLITGFLAFAPPGTLIFGALLILGLIGNVWVAAVGALLLAAIAAAVLLVYKKRGQL